jgi:hypothetical protein
MVSCRRQIPSIFSVRGIANVEGAKKGATRIILFYWKATYPIYHWLFREKVILESHGESRGNLSTFGTLVWAGGRSICGRTWVQYPGWKYATQSGFTLGRAVYNSNEEASYISTGLIIVQTGVQIPSVRDRQNSHLKSLPCTKDFAM